MIRIYVRSYSPLLTHTFCQGRKLCVTAVMAETLWQSVTTWSPAPVCVSEHPSRESRRRLEFPRENASTRAGNLVAEIRVERTIAASPERVFDWLLDPANLTASPVVRKAGWAKDSSGPGVGAVREVTGYGFWVHEQITAYDPPRRCSYVVLRSFPASQHQGGTLTCTHRATAPMSNG